MTLQCLKCHRTFQESDANNLQCPFCGGNAVENPKAPLLRGPMSDEEKALRRIIWIMHQTQPTGPHMCYGDDGELQCCGIDFLRLLPEDLEEAMAARINHPLWEGLRLKMDESTPSDMVCAKCGHAYVYHFGYLTQGKCKKCKCERFERRPPEPKVMVKVGPGMTLLGLK